MFVQTGDKDNWQTRYVLHHPYKGSVSECSAAAAKHNCQTTCKEQTRYGGWSMAECQKTCEAQKKQAVLDAQRYYLTDLPKRQWQERQTLAQLTGWNLADIDRMAGGPLSRPRDDKPVRPADAPNGGGEGAGKKTWWEKLFSQAHGLWQTFAVVLGYGDSASA